MHDRQTALGCTAVPLRKLAVDVASLEHRLLTAETVALFALLLVRPSLNPFLTTLPLLLPRCLTLGTVLAGMAVASYLRFHSKVLPELATRDTGANQNQRFARGFSSVLRAKAQSRKWGSLD